MNKITRLDFHSACGDTTTVTVFGEITWTPDDPIIKTATSRVARKYADHCDKCVQTDPIMEISTQDMSTPNQEVLTNLMLNTSPEKDMRCMDAHCVCLKAIEPLKYAIEIIEGYHPGYKD